VAGHHNRPQEPSLDLVLIEVRAAKAQAAAQITMLDAKAGLILASSTFLAAAVGSLQGALALNHLGRRVLFRLPLVLGGAPHPLVVSVGLATLTLAVLALAVYLTTVLAAWQAYRATTAYVVPAPSQLEGYLSVPEDVTKRAVVRALAESYARLDAPMIAHKYRWTRRALWALLTESVLSAIIVIVTGVLAVST
jgi:hypothetical protein